jgi:predicted nucleic acid-binding protein
MRDMIPAAAAFEKPIEKPIDDTIVLDTNVCLDLFVFHDPRWTALLAALESGAVRAVTRADCRDEYLHVLHYPHLPLDEATRARAAARFDALIQVVAPTSRARILPICTDRDDQKFLEIARDAGAGVLVSKDKAVLKLARRCAREGLFHIMPPDAWVRSQAASIPAATLE